MKKRLFALFCALVLTVSAVPFADALQGESLRAADTLATLNLVRGDHGLDAPATRAQAAVLLVRLAGAEQAAKNDLWISGFRDVPAWAQTEITYAAHQGWITGFTMVDFKPDSPVTANAWCAFLLRMLGYSDKAGDFAVSDAAVFAQHIGLTARAYDGPLTWGQLCEIAAGALTFSCKDDSATVAERLVSSGACPRAAASALGLLDETLTARQAADRLTSAVFQLDLYDTQEELDAQEPGGNASGFFLTADGLAVTNYHAIEDAIHATATLSTGEVYPVESVVWYDPGMDLAVLRISRTSTVHKTTSAFAVLEVVGTSDLRPGDTVYTLSNPLGLGLAVTSGVVSAMEHDVERYDLPCVVNTADISQGSSGGALLNVYGQVVAITSGAYTYGNSMYLAIPADPILTADLTGEGQTLREVLAAEKAASADD